MININTDHQYFCTTMTLCKHRVASTTCLRTWWNKTYKLFCLQSLEAEIENRTEQLQGCWTTYRKRLSNSMRNYESLTQLIKTGSFGIPKKFFSNLSLNVERCICWIRREFFDRGRSEGCNILREVRKTDEVRYDFIIFQYFLGINTFCYENMNMGVAAQMLKAIFMWIKYNCMFFLPLP